jgi:hypothetical protein
MKRSLENSIRFWTVKNIARLCFTEIRLSQVEEHADKYGKLGIGFTRDFIMRSGGRPVIYVPFEPYDGLLERSLKHAYEKSIGNDEIHKPMKFVLGFVKRMWDEHGVEHFDEMEWRIVYDEDPNNVNITKGEEYGEFRFNFTPNDVKVLIFPNENTQLEALNDEFIKEYFSQHMPIAVTLDDCKNF